MKRRNVFGGVFAFSLATVALASCGPGKVTVKFFKGTDLLSEKAYNIGEAIEAPANPAGYTENHMIYTFDAWYEDATAKTGKYETGLKASKEVSYYAGWNVTEEQFFTVKFEDRGSQVESKKYYADQTIIAPANPQDYDQDHKHYTFNGWYDGETKLEDGTKATKDVTYVSKYTPTDIEYTVTFIDEHTGDSTEVKGIFGDTITAPADPASYKDEDSHYWQDFANWKDVTTDAPFVPGSTFTGDQTFRATYQKGNPIEYKASFVSEDGTEERTFSIESATITAPTIPDKEGYDVFWYSEDYGPASSGATITFTTFADIEFQKTETIRSHTIRFLDEDGDELKVVTKEYGSTITAEDCPTDPEHYEGEDHYWHEFDGWYNGDTKLVKGTTTVPDTDVNYQAKFVRGDAIEYTISFVEEGVDPQTKTVTVESPTITAPNFTLTPTTGYEFKWVNGETVVGAGENITFGTAKLPLANTTFTAGEYGRKFTITYDVDGGTIEGGQLTQEVTFGEPYTLKGATKTNFDLEGWMDVNHKKFPSSGVWSTAGDVSLKAGWWVSFENVSDVSFAVSKKSSNVTTAIDSGTGSLGTSKSLKITVSDANDGGIQIAKTILDEMFKDPNVVAVNFDAKSSIRGNNWRHRSYIGTGVANKIYEQGNNNCGVETGWKTFSYLRKYYTVDSEHLNEVYMVWFGGNTAGREVWVDNFKPVYKNIDILGFEAGAYINKNGQKDNSDYRTGFDDAASLTQAFLLEGNHVSGDTNPYYVDSMDYDIKSEGNRSWKVKKVIASNYFALKVNKNVVFAGLSADTEISIDVHSDTPLNSNPNVAALSGPKGALGPAGYFHPANKWVTYTFKVGDFTGNPWCTFIQVSGSPTPTIHFDNVVIHSA